MTIEADSEQRLPRRGVPWGIALAATLLLVILILLPPFLDGRAGALILAAFSTVCHQLPERTMHLAGVPLAVCSRCVGIYVGLAAGVALYPFGGPASAIARHAPIALVIALAVPGADWIAGVSGLWQSGHLVRMITGTIFGLVVGTLIARAAVALSPMSAPVSLESDGR